MRASALDLILVFGWLGVVSVGGGLGIVPEMHRQLVDVHGWLDARAFADGYAMGQLAPGPNMLAVVFYGYAVAGVFGGLLAAVLTVAPGALASALAGRAWATIEDKPWIAWLRRGLVPVGFGLVAAGVAVLGRDVVVDLPRAAFAVLVALAVATRRAKPAIAVLLAGAGGLLLAILARPHDGATRAPDAAPSATIAEDAAAADPLDEKLRHCPLTVETARSEARDVDDGIEITVRVAGAQQLEELANRVHHLEAYTATNGDAGGRHGTGKGGGHMQNCPIVTQRTIVSGEPIDHGFRIRVRANDASKVDELRAETRRRLSALTPP
ncbi:MAG TPA: chromate transporter [Labilithrix sp.]|jgi:chromate transporter